MQNTAKNQPIPSRKTLKQDMAQHEDMTLQAAPPEQFHRICDASQSIDLRISDRGADSRHCVDHKLRQWRDVKCRLIGLLLQQIHVEAFVYPVKEVGGSR